MGQDGNIVDIICLPLQAKSVGTDFSRDFHSAKIDLETALKNINYC